MKKLVTLLTFGLFSTGITLAQDTVFTGANYSNDVFYSLQTKSSSIATNNDWHIAFQLIPQGGPSSSVSVLANFASASVNVYSLHMTASSNFTSLTAADTVGKTNAGLYNSPITWSEGAFNANAGTNIFDYGWGSYNMTSHMVEGDSLYLVTVGNGASMKAYKMTIKKYVSAPIDSIHYTFRLASFDNSLDSTFKIYRKDGFVDRAFSYFNFNTLEFKDRENTKLGNWDLLFTKYAEKVSQGPVTMMYGVTGVLAAPGVKIAEERSVAPQLSTYSNQPLLEDINTIGYDWKSFSQSNMTYQLDSTVSYFVKTNDSAAPMYKIYFTYFGGGANGAYGFNQEAITTNSVKNIPSALSSIAIAPNPSNGKFTLLIDTKDATQQASVIIFDMSGRMMKQYSVTIDKGFNALTFNEHLPTGNYIVNIKTANWQVSPRMVISE